MTGQWVWITGGLGNIGRAFATAMAESGANICLLDIAPCGDDFVNTLIKECDVAVEYVQIDLSQPDQSRMTFSKAIEKIGRIDTLINNAAFVGTSNLEGWIGPFAEQRLDTWQAALNVNLSAPFVLAQTALEALRNSDNGSILNIGSLYGVTGPDMRLYDNTEMGNPAAYAASKGGLIQLTRWLATVLAPDIRVNCLSPGGIYRGQDDAFVDAYVQRTPMGRMGSEADLVGPAILLSSTAGSYITGQNIVVDGGFSVW